MSIIFCVPLMIIALWEAQLSARSSALMSSMSDSVEEGEEDDPSRKDPSTEDEDGMEISKTPFDELVKVFPNTFQVCTLPTTSFFPVLVCMAELR